jgi:hypothetical protein
MDKISKLQIVDPKYWSGLTRESHLGWLGMQDPQYVSKVINNIYEVNYGADNIVSFLEQFPTHYLDEEGTYRWMLHGSDERNIPLSVASLTGVAAVPVAAGNRPGIGRGRFYMFFPERYFEATSVIVGENPDAYSLRVVEDPVHMLGGWRYTVELINGDDNMFVPVEDLAAGTRWSEEFGLVEHELSKRGNSVHHASPLMMENVTSVIRKNYEVPGNMITKGKNKPLAFAFVDQNGKTHTRWIDKLGWDFMVQFRRDIGRLLMHGKSNKLADGQYGNKGESGNTVRAGFGLYEQMDGGNLMYYNNFNLDSLTDFAMQISVGKLKEDSRKFVLSTGEYGLYEFHKAASEKASGFNWLRSGHNLKTINGKMALDEGQMVKYTTINGIEFHVMLDPMKDDPVRNKQMHPAGGLVSSRIYDIFDFGTTGGEANIQKVAVKDNEEFFRYIPGMRDPFTPYNKPSSPQMAASSVDGYAVYKQYIGGIMLRNPLKTGRIIPAILR